MNENLTEVEKLKTQNLRNAVSLKCLESVKLLISKNANPLLKDKDGRTPWQFARHIEKYFREYVKEYPKCFSKFHTLDDLKTMKQIVRLLKEYQEEYKKKEGLL